MRWIVAAAALIVSVSPAAAQRAPNGRPYLSQPLVTSTYSADPAAHIFGGRIYVYASHDVPGPPLSDEPPFQKSEGNSFRMTDFVVLSMDRPGGPVTVHSNILDIGQVPWASRQMWAPDAAYRQGTYYLYFPAKDRAGAFRIGVATSTSPTGPFTARPEPIKGSYSIDPAAFIDDDGTAYLYFGGLNGGQLQKWRDGAFDPDGPPADPRGKRDRAFMPRVARLTADMLEFAEAPREAMIVDEKGKPLLAGDEARRFFEGSWMNKLGGKYVLTYSTGTTHLLVYAVGDTPYGPFTYKGVVLKPVEGWTTHASMIRFDGRWWLFYADSQMSGQTPLRNVKLTELFWDGDAIRTIDPFGK
ncbi:glycoside hydrolase family 43 protein [Sphingomonas sp. LB-2]|uniref:glycoside hydrolase family 43 protein n=1 Tax=Sphingomonas caeni TaxID=2984949 RepID=UPI00222EB394|nr:glycoside hydrolase family 43 protein [Sphingomonas caeni]MCW3847967.1 glycoside hydrolase family 43 protein [Sphingomonas caeni]